MVEKPRVPDEILSASNGQKVEHFKNYTVAHPKLVQIDSRLQQSIREPASKSLIFVYGPTGVGKTTMRHHVEADVHGKYQSSSSNSPSTLPLASVEAPASESGNFQWKDFYVRILRALNEPFVEDKIDFGNGISRNDNNQLIIKRSTAKSALRRSLEKALEYRKPKALLIDEAQHLTHMSSGRRLRDQLECLKSLANISETTLVLIGTYDLLAFRNLSGQLSRRSIDIHFCRYHADRDEDLDPFKRVIKSFQSHLPLESEPNLLEEWSFLYERSLGCVGILKDWFTIAYSDFLESDQKSFGLDHLTHQALSVSQCEKILKDIEQGEKRLRENQEQLHHLRRKLDLEYQKEGETQKPSSGRKLVGERNPKRDPVGTEP